MVKIMCECLVHLLIEHFRIIMTMADHCKRYHIFFIYLHTLNQKPSHRNTTVMHYNMPCVKFNLIITWCVDPPQSQYSKTNYNITDLIITQIKNSNTRTHLGKRQWRSNLFTVFMIVTECIYHLPSHWNGRKLLPHSIKIITHKQENI